MSIKSIGGMYTNLRKRIKKENLHIIKIKDTEKSMF